MGAGGPRAELAARSPAAVARRQHLHPCPARHRRAESRRGVRHQCLRPDARQPAHQYPDRRGSGWPQPRHHEHDAALLPVAESAVGMRHVAVRRRAAAEEKRQRRGLYFGSAAASVGQRRQREPSSAGRTRLFPLVVRRLLEAYMRRVLISACLCSVIALLGCKTAEKRSAGLSCAQAGAARVATRTTSPCPPPKAGTARRRSAAGTSARPSLARQTRRCWPRGSAPRRGPSRPACRPSRAAPAPPRRGRCRTGVCRG